MTWDAYNSDINAENLRPYILAGKAIFTLFSQKTGLRYTFRVLHKSGEEWYRIERLYGDDNTKDYRHIGVFKLELVEGDLLKGITPHCIVHTKFTHYGPAESQIKYFLNVVYGILKWPQTMYMYQSGRCARCGRLLTTPESIESGFGPKCRWRL